MLVEKNRASYDLRDYLFQKFKLFTLMLIDQGLLLLFYFTRKIISRQEQDGCEGTNAVGSSCPLASQSQAIHIAVKHDIGPLISF